MTKRKPLNDALAQNFVYGQGEMTQKTPTVSPPSTSSEQSSMSRLLEVTEQKEATKRFTVDLPESMHRKLSMLAARTGRTKADIIKTLLEELLKDANE
jgi:hypothetical protein